MFIYIRRVMTLLAFYLSLSIGGACASNVPHVVVSIKPLQSLVAAVMGNVGTPGLIVKGSGSEHGYVLKPSDAGMIAHADIVFITNPDMERFLIKSITSLGPKTRLISLSQAPGVVLLPIRNGGLFEPHEHGEHDWHGGEHPGAIDFHFWLDPENAKAAILYIAQILAEADPEHTSLYNDNARLYNARLDQLEGSVQDMLKNIQGRHYIVFHDAYHYFEYRFSLEAVGSIALDPEHQPGVKRLDAIRKLILDKNVVCVFTEPQFPNKLVNTVIENTTAKTAQLDPLGASLKEGPDLYPQLIMDLANNLVSCLQSK